MKTCYNCKVEKDDNQFHKNGERLQSMCKDCRKKYIREHYLIHRSNYIKQARESKTRKRDWLSEIKSELVCGKCGESDIACLDFHHLDPKEKEGSIGSMMNYGKDKVLAEIRKCIVLCSNCHRKLHYYERNNVTLAQR